MSGHCAGFSVLSIVLLLNNCVQVNAGYDDKKQTMSRKENNGNQPLNIKVKPAHHILAGDHKVDFNSGCSVMDITFPHVFYVEVS